MLAVPTKPKVSVEQFTAEVTKAAARSIEFGSMPSNTVELGYTDFKHTGSILIQLRDGLPEDVRESVIAHELGHVMLRNRHLSPVASLSAAGQKRTRNFMVSTVETLKGCYEEPLADLEAKKRGFRPDLINDFVAAEMKNETMFDLENKRKLEDFAWNYEAVFLYCFELRPHTFKASDIEQQFAIEPEIGTKLKRLKRSLGVSGCDTSITCFERTKRLRDLAGFSELILLENPRTGKME